ncbi:MAG: GNAT family N-acetyltransferase [Acaryochloridaceae cyanobacterium CSU_3_4]|nr:GNAT family N-acetyltransferase [Acaryochloridaceae cyanobacterium CSU_3_4]
MPQDGKFAGVDFSKTLIEKVNSALKLPGQGFRCKRREFITYWKQGRIQREVKACICQCWVIRHKDALAGYITLLADKLEVDTQLLEGEGVRYRTFPAIKIGLLAADERAKGAGSSLVEWALEYVAVELASAVGIRFMTVDALYDADEKPPYDASAFYQKFGFQFVNPDETVPENVPYRTMYFDLKPLIDLSLE